MSFWKLPHHARPAAILMDITMAPLDGLEAARLLKASAVTRHLKIVAYTAKPDVYNGPLSRLLIYVLPTVASPEAVLAAVQR